MNLKEQLPHTHEHVMYMSRRTAELLWRAFFSSPPDTTGPDLYSWGGAEVLFDDRLQFGIVEVALKPEES